MTEVPKRLPTRRLLEYDKGKACTEAHVCMYRLIQAGYFEAAHRVALALLRPGTWRLPRGSALVYSTWQTVLWLCSRLRRDPPAHGDHADTAQMAAQWFVAARQTRREETSLWNRSFAASPAQTEWSEAEIDALVASVRPGAFGAPFNGFQHDAKLALGNLVAARVECKPETGTRHAMLADAIERGARIAFPKDAEIFAIEAALSAARLDFANGKRDAAVERLARLLPADKLVSGRDCQLIYVLYPDLLFVPLGDLLATHALAPALGITQAGVAAYLDAFARRSPQTLTAEKILPWKTVLREYSARVIGGGMDAASLQANLECGEPASKALLQRARRGQLLNAACSEEGVAALEARLGISLPPSYRDFLLATDGMLLPDFVALLPAAQVDWLRNLDTCGAIEGWNQGASEASDDQYHIYGIDQDCIHMRPRHLRTALQVSTTCDGDVLVLVPDVRFGDEWEAWFLGAKNPGAYRHRSFRDLMQQRVLAEAD